MAKDRLPYFKFYPGDWRRSPNLSVVSFAAKGVWIELLSLMHECPRRGVLELKDGVPFTDDHIAKAIGADKEECSELLRELEENGVFTRNEDGAIVCNMMVRQELERQRNKRNGAKGGNPNLVKQNQPVNHPVNPPVKAGDNQRVKAVVGGSVENSHNHSYSDSSSDSDNTKDVSSLRSDTLDSSSSSSDASASSDSKAESLPRAESSSLFEEVELDNGSPVKNGARPRPSSIGIREFLKMDGAKLVKRGPGWVRRANELIHAYHTIYQPEAKIGENDKKKIRARMAEHWSLRDLMLAIDGNHYDEWSNENNVHWLGHIYKSESMVLKYVNRAKEVYQRKTHNDPARIGPFKYTSFLEKIGETDEELATTSSGSAT